MTHDIRFGTDGWRGPIAGEVTFANMQRVAAATGAFLAETGRHRHLALGYDTRFLSPDFARTVAETLAGQGFVVHLSDRPCPTPAVALAAQAPGVAAGLQITASHNPYTDNGFKIKAPTGASASPEWTDAVRARLDRPAAARPGGRIVTTDLWTPYETRLAALVDVEWLVRTDTAVIVDPMHGVTSGLLHRLLPGRAVEIRWEADPCFGEGNPEPIAANLRQLSRMVQAKYAPLKVGFAFDGDGDRIGVVRGDGTFVNSHQIIALLLRHLAESRGGSGDVVVTVSTSEIVRRLAAHYGLAVHETPVGFKHIAARMIAGDVLIGGEESGGIGVKGHLPERDGPLMALLLLEMMAERKQDLGESFAEIEAMVGWRHHYARRDRPHPHPGAVMAAVAARPPAEVAGRRLDRVQTTDGTKLHFADGSWLLVRGSGTEPLLRLYAEAQDPGTVAALLDWAEGTAASV